VWVCILRLENSVWFILVASMDLFCATLNCRFMQSFAGCLGNFGYSCGKRGKFWFTSHYRNRTRMGERKPSYISRSTIFESLQLVGRKFMFLFPIPFAGISNAILTASIKTFPLGVSRLKSNESISYQDATHLRNLITIRHQHSTSTFTVPHAIFII